MPRPPERSRRRAATATADGRLAALLRGDPAAFTAARDALARELAGAGDAAGAARVKALRKPTVATVVLNRLAADEGPEVARLLDAGERLRQAQARAVRGGAEGLREANEDLRSALSALLAAAERIAAEGGRAAGAALLGKVERGLRAAAAGGPEVREALRAGALEQEPEEEGVDLLAGLAMVPQPTRTATATATASETATATRTAAAARKASARAATRHAAAAEKARLEARRRAEEKVASALRAVEAAERTLADAREKLRAARDARARM